MKLLEGDEWSIMERKPFHSDRLGTLATYDYGHPIGQTIAIINITNARNLGLGRESVIKLANHYGSLSSDPQGNTSTDAVKMWLAVGGRKIPTDKNTKGFFYRLDKK